MDHNSITPFPALAAVDLDGTLLGANGRLDGRNRAAVVAWFRAGRALAILTSRSPHGMLDVLAELKVPCIAGAFSGCLVWRSSPPDWMAGEPLIDAPLPPELVRRIWNTCIEHSVPVILYGRDSTMGSIRTPLVEREIGVTGEAISYSTDVYSGDTYKLSLFVDERQRSSVLSGISILDSVAISVSRSGIIELTSACSSKGHALSTAYAGMGLGPADVIALGDADNDVTMFDVAGLAIAVPGATKAARNSADLVLDGNGSDLVGLALVSALAWHDPESANYAALGRYRRRDG
jgi:Cof subfamily protein (haloacid dehalogenase superfamily)